MVTETQAAVASPQRTVSTPSLADRHALIRRLGALEIVILLVGTVLVSL